MRYRLRTLVLLTAVAPPFLWLLWKGDMLIANVAYAIVFAGILMVGLAVMGLVLAVAWGVKSAVSLCGGGKPGNR